MTCLSPISLLEADQFQVLGWVLWARVDGCMEAGRAWGRWRWAVWGGRGFQPNSLPGAQATQQAGSKAPHLWPQGSPNIRSILFRNLLFCYTLMCFYRFPAVTTYCFPNKKFKKPNKRLVSYPSFKDAVSAESLWLGVFNYTLPKGSPSTLQLPGDELLPFTLHVHLRPVVRGCPVPRVSQSPKWHLWPENVI